MAAPDDFTSIAHTVLVVEDDEGLGSLIQRLLQREGLLTARVGSGEDAVEWLDEHEADLVLLDYSLPDMHADRLIDLFEQRHRDIPFIVATGHGSETIAVEMMKRGARDYLVKGVSFLDLLGPQVTRVLGEVERERRLARAEQALRESEERLRTVVEASNAGIWEWDLTDRLGRLSDEALAIAGLPPDAGPIDGAAARRFIHPHDFEVLADAVRESIAEDKPIRLEMRILWPKGESRWVTLSAKARYDAERQRGRVAGSLVDITDRKRAEIALEARVRQQAAVAELGKQALEGAGIAQLLRDAVKVVAETLEVDCARIFEMTEHRELTAGGAAFGSPEALAGICWGSGPERQARLTLSDGEPVIVVDYAADARFAGDDQQAQTLRSGVTVAMHGSAARFMALGAYAARPRVFTQDDVHFLQTVANTVADAMVRKASEAEARQQRLQLAHVMRINAMGKMVSELAHEINQPLYAIANYAAACREVLTNQPAAPAELREWNQHISEQANRAGEILRRLSGFVRKESPQRTAVPLGDLIRKIVGLVEIDARVNQTQIVLELHPGQEQVFVDRVQIEQVVVNLVVNAIEAMHTTAPQHRKVTIRSRIVGVDAAARVEVDVEDAGPPVSEHAFHRLFDAFFTTKATGLGMGLAISRSIMESHHGELGAIKNPAGGLTFRFSLPLATENTHDGF